MPHLAFNQSVVSGKILGKGRRGEKLFGLAASGDNITQMDFTASLQRDFMGAPFHVMIFVDSSFMAEVSLLFTYCRKLKGPEE